MSADHSSDVFHHVRDFAYLELPGFLGGETAYLPVIRTPWFDLQLTKFMVLQVVAGFLTLFIFTVLGQKVASGRPVKGRFWGFWEMLALFIRDEVVRPAIGTGHHDHGDGHEDHGHGEHGHGGHGHGKHAAPTGSHPADRYLPYIWTCFFYVLFCNLLGAVPWLGSATGAMSVTAALAIATLLVVIISGSRELGVVGYWKALVPSMDLPGPIAVVLIPGIWFIEFGGLMIKHGVLAVRLFANIMAGHTVIAVILGFIAAAGSPDVAAQYPWLIWLVAPASVLGQVAIGMLELFVSFLQAYIFAFLSALFIGAAVHPH